MTIALSLVLLIAALVITWLAIARKQSTDDPMELLQRMRPGIQSVICPYVGEFLDTEASEDALWREIGGVRGVMRLFEYGGILVTISLDFAKKASPEAKQGSLEEYELQLKRSLILRFSLLRCIPEAAFRKVLPWWPRVYFLHAASTYYKMCVTTQTLFEAYRPIDIEKAVQSL